MAELTRNSLLLAGMTAISLSLPTQAAPVWDVQAAGSRAFTHYQALHRMPELGKQEIRTATYIRQHLQAAGIRDLHSVQGLPTAVIAVVDTGRPGRTIALRAEMDARKGQETSRLPYASQVPGLMHSCGHDAHAAVLLAAAETIARQRTRLNGRFVFVFQPAEETPGGADDIVESGILERLGVEAMVALHAAPGLPVGSIELAPGPILAGSQYFTVTVNGRGSHAAAPYEGDDVPAVTAELISDLVRLPARRFDALSRPVVLSVTSIATGDAKSANVLPKQAVFRGTLRSFSDPAVAHPGNPSVKEQIEQFLTVRARSLGVTATIAWRSGPPPTVNDAGLYGQAVTGLQSRWPALRIGTARPSMFAEDFAYYTPRFKSLYAALGIAKDALGHAPVHTDGFTVHPEALTVGTRLMLELATLD